MKHIEAGLIHALPVSDRRCMDRKESASYLGVSTNTFDKLVGKGELPRPIRLLGRKVWDRSALDRSIDIMSGVGTSEHAANEIDRLLGLS
jgi:predicted DNA-binding transcriptional regulator AlpA